MKTSLISLLFGSSISFIVLLASGASLATEGFTFFSAINLALGMIMYASSIAFWGDAKVHETRMECMQKMVETLEGLRNELEKVPKPPKASKK